MSIKRKITRQVVAISLVLMLSLLFVSAAYAWSGPPTWNGNRLCNMATGGWTEWRHDGVLYSAQKLSREGMKVNYSMWYYPNGGAVRVQGGKIWCPYNNSTGEWN